MVQLLKLLLVHQDLLLVSKIQSQGSGYDINNNDLFFDNSKIGGGQGGFITITTAGITTAVGDSLQITGFQP